MLKSWLGPNFGFTLDQIKAIVVRLRNQSEEIEDPNSRASSLRVQGTTSFPCTKDARVDFIVIRNKRHFPPRRAEASASSTQHNCLTELPLELKARSAPIPRSHFAQHGDPHPRLRLFCSIALGRVLAD
jgi:hypothetical protein